MPAKRSARTQPLQIIAQDTETDQNLRVVEGDAPTGSGMGLKRRAPRAYSPEFCCAFASASARDPEEDARACSV